MVRPALSSGRGGACLRPRPKGRPRTRNAAYAAGGGKLRPYTKIQKDRACFQQFGQIPKLCDYNARWEELAASHNQQVVDLLRFLDWMLRLPSELDRQFWSEMKEYEKEKRMQYMTSFERFSFEKGLKQGKEKGLKQGIRQGMQRGVRQGVQRGIQQGEAAALKRLLVRRFGALPAWAEKLLAGATLEQLACWLDRVVEAARLEDVLGSRESA